MGIHFLHYAHGNEHIGIHDAIHDTFVTIARNVGFHVGWEQLQVLPSTTLNSSYRRVDIVLTKDGIRIIVDVVITNPRCTNFMPFSIIPN
jgi:hypothetical protein